MDIRDMITELEAIDDAITKVAEEIGGDSEKVLQKKGAAKFLGRVAEDYYMMDRDVQNTEAELSTAENTIADLKEKIEELESRSLKMTPGGSLRAGPKITLCKGEG